MHYAMNSLVEKGLVKLGNFTAAENKRRYAYIRTPRELAQKVLITKRFLARKIEEYEALKAEIDALTSEIEDVVEIQK